MNLNGIKYTRLDVPAQSINRKYFFIILLVVATIIFMLTFQQHSNPEEIDVKIQNGQEFANLEHFLIGMDEKIEKRLRDLENLREPRTSSPPESEHRYRRRPETAHIDCKRIFDGDKAYTSEIAEKRVKMIPTKDLDKSCSAVRRRVLPPSNLDPIKFGVAFARIVYTDYEMIEDEVRRLYHPQNTFCFAIDKKAPKEFHEAMLSLASCLPNILLLPEEKAVDSGGHNVNLAHYNCMKALINKPGWGYLMLLQNHDVVGKSIYELVDIYEIMGGANDVEITPEIGRANKKFAWTPKSLQLFRNETGISDEILNQKMKMAKGAAQSSMSHAAVEWMVRTANLDKFIEQMNSGGFGVDEQFMESFQVSDFLGMPGHFTDACLKEKKNTEFVTRMSRWVYGSSEKCGTKTVRHAICLLGVEDLPSIATFPNLMFNKMMPDFDYGAVDCIGELIFNRTVHRRVDHILETSYYANMVNVIYHKNRNNPDFKLNCTPNYTRWGLRKWI